MPEKIFWTGKVEIFSEALYSKRISYYLDRLFVRGIFRNESFQINLIFGDSTDVNGRTAWYPTAVERDIDKDVVIKINYSKDSPNPTVAKYLKPNVQRESRICVEVLFEDEWKMGYTYGVNWTEMRKYFPLYDEKDDAKPHELFRYYGEV